MDVEGDVGMWNVRVMLPMAVRPLRSVRRVLASSHIDSRSGSGSQVRGLLMMEVRYLGTPLESTETLWGLFEDVPNEVSTARRSKASRRSFIEGFW